ncbi:MAG: hypothetical protein ACRC6R_08045 [Bacteroidales bacterium]
MKPNELLVIRKAIIAASGQVLTRHFPEKYYEMESDDLDDFVIMFATEEYDDWPVDDIWDAIDELTQAFLNFYQSLSK